MVLITTTLIVLMIVTMVAIMMVISNRFIAIIYGLLFGTEWESKFTTQQEQLW